MPFNTDAKTTLDRYHININLYITEMMEHIISHYNMTAWIFGAKL